MQGINVTCLDERFLDRASELAKKLSLPLVTALPERQLLSENFQSAYQLEVTEQGLSLKPGYGSEYKHGPIVCSFTSGANDHRRKFGGGKGQDIAKAMGITAKYRPSVVDLTAGLGTDSFVLSSLGCAVTMIERHPVVHSLLEDGLCRASEQAQSDSELGPILDRLTLIDTDSRDYLDSLEEEHCPDVFYLDPMFPERKKSAKVKKEMQAFHEIVGADDDASELLSKALEKPVCRIVVKRPAYAKQLAGLAPVYSIKGKSTRFDIYPLKKLPT